MSRNRGRDTKPEVSLRKACFALGLRYRLQANLPGRPDFVFPKYRLAVFVDGCFWHGCPLHYQAPRTRAAFWSAKRKANATRDGAVAEALQDQGWQVLRVWEHEVRTDVGLAARTVLARCRQAASQRCRISCDNDAVTPTRTQDRRC
jgi:DNA mismatch endonuclease (patch repair protein)